MLVYNILLRKEKLETFLKQKLLTPDVYGSQNKLEEENREKERSRKLQTNWQN